MSKFRSKLSRMNNLCCEQVMPVAVIPICAISCEIPRPIYLLPTENVDSSINYTINQPEQQNIECTNCQNNSEKPYTISNYYPGINVKVGTILTNTTGAIPNGYLLCDGAEISRIEYSSLFEEIGITYGEGTNNTTFNLPNLIEANTGNNFTYIIKI